LRCEQSEEDNSQFVGFYFTTVHDPVIHVVVQITIPHLEVEVLEYTCVVH